MSRLGWNTPHSTHRLAENGVAFFGVVDHFMFSLSKYFGVKPQDTTGTVNIKCPLPRSQESSLSLPHHIGS